MFKPWCWIGGVISVLDHHCYAMIIGDEETAVNVTFAVLAVKENRKLCRVTFLFQVALKRWLKTN